MEHLLCCFKNSSCNFSSDVFDSLEVSYMVAKLVMWGLFFSWCNSMQVIFYDMVGLKQYLYFKVGLEGLCLLNSSGSFNNPIFWLPRARQYGLVSCTLPVQCRPPSQKVIKLWSSLEILLIKKCLKFQLRNAGTAAQDTQETC